MLGRTHLLVGLMTLGTVEQGTRRVMPYLLEAGLTGGWLAPERVSQLPSSLIQPHPIQGLPTGLALCATAVMLGALAPDIDAERSEIKSTLGRVGSLSGWLLRLFGVGHRGLTHYGLTGLAVLLVSTLLGGWLGYADVGLVFGLGHLSHLLADAMTLSGAPLLWPWPGSVHVLPRPLRIRTGGLVEQFIFVGLGVLVIILLITLLPPELSQALRRWLA